MSEVIQATIKSINGLSSSGKTFSWTIIKDGEEFRLATFKLSLTEIIGWGGGDQVEIPVSKFDERWGYTLDHDKMSDLLLKPTLEKKLAQFTPSLNIQGRELFEEVNKIVLSAFQDNFYVGKNFCEYSPSSAGTCKRQILLNKWFKALTTDIQAAIKVRDTELAAAKLNNKFGDALHDGVYNRIGHRTAYHSHEKTLKMEFDEFVLKGKYDLLLEKDDQLIVIDIKTRQSKYFLPSLGLLDYYIETVKKNMQQLACYIVLLRNKYPDKKILSGGIFEIFADEGQTRFIPYIFRNEDFEFSRSFFISLTEFEKKRELPEIPREYNSDSFPCSFCKFSPACY